MKIAILLYPGFTVLDAVGPYHSIGAVPGAEFSFVAERPGPVSNGGAFTMEAHQGIDEIDALDVLLVPGGIAAIELAATGGPLIEWIRAIHPTTTWTTSVCTGSLMLGAAGVLDGKRATSHWYCLDDLAAFGAIPVSERVVEDGKVMTAAGVSAGIDMGLRLLEHLAGTSYAQAAQLDMEYDPDPPFTSGHPRCAPPEVTAFVKGMYDSVLGR